MGSHDRHVRAIHGGEGAGLSRVVGRRADARHIDRPHRMRGMATTADRRADGPDLCVPKLLWSHRERRLLSLAERFTDPVLGWCHSNEALKEHGLEAVDNTPEELRDVVAEMLDRLDGVYADAPGDGELFDRYHAALREIGVRGAARIGAAFLRKYAALLPAARRVAAA